MKIVIFKLFNGAQLNLFKLRNGRVVHIQTQDLPQIKESPIPDIACYIQKDGKAALASKADLVEYTIEEAIKFYSDYDVSELDFEIKEL